MKLSDEALFNLAYTLVQLIKEEEQKNRKLNWINRKEQKHD